MPPVDSRLVKRPFDLSALRALLEMPQLLIFGMQALEFRRERIKGRAPAHIEQFRAIIFFLGLCQHEAILK